MPRRDPVQPFIAACVSAFFYWIALNLTIPALRFLGGEIVAITVSQLIAAGIGSALGLAIFESAKLPDIGLRWLRGSRRNLTLGLLIGAGGAAAVVLIPVALGLARYESVTNAGLSWRVVLFTPLLLLCGAAGEEIIFRGFPLQYLIRGWGPVPAVVLTGAVFGLLHAQNPSSTVLSVLNTAGFGILFAVALLRSRDLWLPIGMHFGWNLTLPFLGAELSGLTIRVTRYQLAWNARDLWSGGTYGPEAGLLSTLVLIALFWVVWKLRVIRGAAYLLDSESPSWPES